MSSELDAISQLGPEHYAELAQAAQEFYAAGDKVQAIGHLMLAIKADPSAIAAKVAFAEWTFDLAISAHNPFMQGIVTDCLQTEGLDKSRLRAVWYALLIHDPRYRDLFSFAGLYDIGAVDDLKNMSVFADDYFTAGVSSLVVNYPGLEPLLTDLRRALLTQPGRFGAGVRVKVAAALSHYCFQTEYIFVTEAEEEKQVSILKGKIESGATSAEEVAVAACYFPLSSLKNAGEIGTRLRGDAVLASIIALQVDEQEKIAVKAMAVPSITAVIDAVSIDVRGQYEEFPYPRWKYLAPFYFEERFRKELSEPGLKVLSAGCGTGREASMIAVALPQASILAVDLSKASLAYASMQAENLGLRNVEFRHGDILELGSVGNTFDFIASSGVLHHMKDPVQGWRVLTGLLKKGGLMNVGLYSKTARRHILAAQEIARRKGYRGDAQGIRRFRRDAISILKPDVYGSIAVLGDYYQMSTCRDLLFHVQEHDYDIPQIQAELAELGLEFIGFSNAPAVIEAYRKTFPEDPAGLNLSNWDVFERDNPDIFSAMYQFWCRKPA